MILKNVKVKNFLSVFGETQFPVDRNVTVLLGANDHGKSNLLKALTYLNDDSPIKVGDENWDAKNARLDFDFKLSADEIAALNALLEKRNADVTTKEAAAKAAAEAAAKEAAKAAVEAAAKEAAAKAAAEAAAKAAAEAAAQTVVVSLPAAQVVTPASATQPSSAVAANPPVPSKPTAATHSQPSILPKTLPSKPTASAAPIPVPPIPLTADHQLLKKILGGQEKTLTISRIGAGTALSIDGQLVPDLPQDLQTQITKMIPRVELFDAFSGELQDSVTSAEISEATFEFLQGVFYCAGLNPLDSKALFEQTDETERTLQNASKTLDAELRNLWTQGHDLHFELKHRDSKIEFQADDPTVKARKARMSKRSAGVTQFFRLSMVLHARRKKHPANSYIYVFDEPGVLLHPKGQKDLLQVFEALSGNTQIIYATHSLFMLNQNFPERHRLIAKDENGTKVDSKPYRANWRYAVDALGVHLTANILFSPNMLLVEGDSDPMYIYELVRVLNNLDEIDADANLLGIMSYTTLPNLRFLIQTFKADSNERLVSILFDGDNQGKAYYAAVEALRKKNNVDSIFLGKGTAIEDYCLYPELFLSAVETTLRDSLSAESRGVPADLRETIKQSWSEYKAGTLTVIKNKTPGKPKKNQNAEDSEPALKRQAEEKSQINAGYWFKQLSEQVLDVQSSKVALARNYVSLAREQPLKDGLDEKQVAHAKKLISEIATALKLPNLKAKHVLEAPSSKS
jgi:AAA ATPase domain